MNKVLKFGGTSVGTSQNMRRVAEIIRSEESKITVLSAMSGTTDSLVQLISLKKEQKSGIEIIEFLLKKYESCITELLKTKQEEALVKMHTIFSEIGYILNNFDDFSEKKILAQGELLTSAIFALYLEELGLSVRLLNAPDFVTTDHQGMVETHALKAKLQEAIAGESPATFFVTQGFICTDSKLNISNLGRGGSDYSAALMGAAIGATEVQIWTDIDGMHNNDPRYVENTYPIRLMSFDEAAELAYFGAKILHPAAIQPCKEADIDVRLKNTMNPEAVGTLISDKEDYQREFHAVAAKDKITLIRIHSTRMLMAYGFLRRVFEIFEQHRTPIDMITTSEVAVSLTIDSDCRLTEIVDQLKELGTIEVEQHNSIVCVVGNIDQERIGVAVKVLEALRNVPIKMISYGASHRSMVLLIDSEHKTQTLKQLNASLFE